MKIGSVKYLIKEAFKGAWANRLMSLASIGVLVACMVVIGLALLISENVTLAIGKLEKQNVVMVYMKDQSWALYSDEVDIPAETLEAIRNGENVDKLLEEYSVIDNKSDVNDLIDKIKNIDNVHSVEYISGDDGLKSLKSDMPEGQASYFTFLDDEYGNPLSGSAKVTMTEMSKFDSTVEQISKLNGVHTIKTHDDLAEKIDAIKSGVYVAGFWIIAILIIISLVIVSNTIRVTMYNRKLEISIMKAVGATDAFVRIPFIIEGMLIGLISALISEGIIYFCYRVATEKIETMLGAVVPFGDVYLNLFIVFAVIGLLAGTIGSVFMIGKYLKHEGSEFAAI